VTFRTLLGADALIQCASSWRVEPRITARDYARIARAGLLFAATIAG
jgi:hypothetical protein